MVGGCLDHEAHQKMDASKNPTTRKKITVKFEPTITHYINTELIPEVYAEKSKEKYSQ